MKKFNRYALICLVTLLPFLNPSISYATNNHQELEMPLSGVVSPKVDQEPILLGEGELKPDMEVAEALLKKQITQQKLQKVKGYYGVCSCVMFVKNQLGMTKPIGRARNWERNSSIPIIGGVVITNESRSGHVALITNIEGSSITVIESNFKHFVDGDCPTTTRVIDVNNPIILGFWIEQ